MKKREEKPSAKYWTDEVLVWFKLRNAPVITIFSDGYVQVSANTEQHLDSTESPTTLMKIKESFPKAFDIIMSYKRGELKVK